MKECFLRTFHKLEAEGGKKITELLLFSFNEQIYLDDVSRFKVEGRAT
ncbi:MAG: hypothetical protein V2G48_06845 [bacterium JZ-2024 1]